MQQLISQLNQMLEKFKIDALCIKGSQHRHFSFFDLQLLPGCRIRKISNCAQELALALHAKTSPIVRPMPEKGVVRLQMVFSNPEILNFGEFKYSIPNGVLPFLLGETDEGQEFWVDMARNPHLLVAGTTGSGKSVLLHLLISNALKRSDVILYLADTKQVEFEKYRNSDYRIRWVAQDYSSTLSMLDWLLEEMEQRYAGLAKIGAVSIESCRYLDKIVVIIDEVADLMLLDKGRRFERNLCRLAQKARAAGIYLVIATQRPSVDVITGLIKANFPGRLACRVASKTDSQVILDMPGAENLLGRGDALFKNPFMDLTRLQIAFPN